MLRRFEIDVLPLKKSTHVQLRKVIEGEERNFVAVIHHNEVAPAYIHKLRRVFHLMPEHGVTDDEFYGDR